MTVALDEKEARAFAAENPKVYEEIWRDQKIFLGLRVFLSEVPVTTVPNLIERSWRHTAHKQVVAAYDER